MEPQAPPQAPPQSGEATGVAGSLPPAAPAMTAHRNNLPAIAASVTLPTGRGISFGRLKQHNKMEGFAAPQTKPGLLASNPLQMHPMGSSSHEQAADDGTSVPVLAVAGLPGDDIPSRGFDVPCSPSRAAPRPRLYSDGGSNLSNSGSEGCLTVRDGDVGGSGVGGGGSLAASSLLVASGGAMPSVLATNSGGNGGSEGVVGSLGMHRHPAASVSASMLSSARAITLPLSSAYQQRRAVEGGDNVSAPRPDPGVLKRKRAPDTRQGVLVLGNVVYGGRSNTQLQKKILAVGDRVAAAQQSESLGSGGGTGGGDGSSEGFFRIKLSETRHVDIPRLAPGVGDMTPDQYLTKILDERGYDSRRSPALEVEHYRRRPSEKMVTDYDMHFVQAVRDRDIAKITSMHAEGRDMNACNKYGESVMHMACRRGDGVLVKHLVALGASMQVSDDFGRTPLHDACWTPEPCFDVVMYLLEHDIRLLRLLDRRGSTPLAYVRKEHHPMWCAFFEYQKDNFWMESDATPSATSAAMHQPEPQAAL